MEVFLPVALRLMADVLPHLLDVHRTDTEFAVARLPREISIPRVLPLDPTAGRTLDLLHDARGHMVLRLREQNVDVVANGIDFDERRVLVLEDAVM